MKKIKEIFKIVIISIVILGLVATYLLAGLASTPRTQPEYEYSDAESMESYEATEPLTPAEDSAQPSFSGPPAGAVPYADGPSTPPPAY